MVLVHYVLAFCIILLLWSWYHWLWCIISDVLYYVVALVTEWLVNHWFDKHLASSPFSDLNSGSRTAECLQRGIRHGWWTSGGTKLCRNTVNSMNKIHFSDLKSSFSELISWLNDWNNWKPLGLYLFGLQSLFWPEFWLKTIGFILFGIWSVFRPETWFYSNLATVNWNPDWMTGITENH